MEEVVLWMHGGGDEEVPIHFRAKKQAKMGGCSKQGA